MLSRLAPCTIKAGNYWIAFTELITYTTFFIVSCSIWADFDIMLKKINDDHRSAGEPFEPRMEVHILFIMGGVSYFICIPAATVLLVGITRDSVHMLGIWILVRVVAFFANIAMMVVTLHSSGFRRPVDFDGISMATAPFFICVVVARIAEIKKGISLNPNPVMKHPFIT